MKCGDFSSILRIFAGLVDVAGARAARDQIIMVAAAFDATPELKVSDFAKRVASVRDPGDAGTPSLANVVHLLSALKSLLDKTAKAAVLTDVSCIEKLLCDRASMEIGAFVRMASEAAAGRRPTGNQGTPIVRDDLVIHYKEKLEASLGDEEKFKTIYDELRANAVIGKSEIVALAKQMTGSGARTEDAALKKIWNRHRSLVVFKAKSRATGGRSAA